MEEPVKNEVSLHTENDKTSPENPRKLKYVRRLDRTPEKDIEARSDEAKKVIYHKRALVNKVKDKIDRLENDVDER